MKNAILFAALLVAVCSNGQKFHFRKDGGTDFIIVAADSIPASKLYSRTLLWIGKNYRKENVKAKTVNKMIRVDGLLLTAFTMSADSLYNNYGASYSLEIHFKKGRYRVKYFHHSLIADGERPSITLTDITNSGVIFEDKVTEPPKKQYEARVQKILNALHRALLSHKSIQ